MNINTSLIYDPMSYARMSYDQMILRQTYDKLIKQTDCLIRSTTTKLTVNIFST